MTGLVPIRFYDLLRGCNRGRAAVSNCLLAIMRARRIG